MLVVQLAEQLAEPAALAKKGKREVTDRPGEPEHRRAVVARGQPHRRTVPASTAGLAADSGSGHHAQVSAELADRLADFQRCIERRDTTAAEAILDDDYALVLVYPVPAVMHRPRWLALLPDYVVHEYEVEEANIDVDGDSAAVVQRARMRATVLGEDRSGLFVITDVWRRLDGEWRLWRRHSTAIQAGALPG